MTHGRNESEFGESLDKREIEVLLDSLKASHEITLAALDHAERELAATRAWFAARRAGRNVP